MSLMARTMANRMKEGKRFAVLLCDVNGLDRISVMYGREVGDALIETLRATLLETHVEAALQALGGDETCAVIPLEPSDDRLAVTEGVRARIDEALRQVAPVNAPVSISGGWSFFPEDGTTPEDLLDAMEVRLLRIKARVGKRLPLYE